MREPAAARAARLIVENGAVYTRIGGEPFFFTSGWASPIFIDVKRLISLPAVRNALIDMATDALADALREDAVDLVAGCELAGVPFAAILADRLRLPLVVVQKQARGFGRLAGFEGTFEPGARALLVDDLSTDGVGKARFRATLERAEATVPLTFVCLDYRVFPEARAVTALTTLKDVAAAAAASGTLTGTALAEVEAFANDAPAWSRRHGGIAALLAG